MKAFAFFGMGWVFACEKFVESISATAYQFREDMETQSREIDCDVACAKSFEWLTPRLHRQRLFSACANLVGICLSQR
jgi:hypothetical protein